MKKIASLYFKFLPNEAHFEFFEHADRMVSQAGTAVLTALGPLAEDLNRCLAKESACMCWIRKSSLTPLIAEADARLDSAIVGLSAQIGSACHSMDASVSSAARRLHILLKNHGRVIKKSYSEKMGAVRAILQHLEDDMRDDVQAIGAGAWTAAVAETHERFLSLFNQRLVESLKKPEEKFREVRRESEAVWHDIVRTVNAGAELNLSPDYEALIDALNPGIASLNDTFHRIRHSISAAEPDPIEPQPFTGQPCTPVPAVMYAARGGILRLELGRDFNITYRNNVDAGNASCIIHGKGGYRGHKMVTFMIQNEYLQ
jgi:hypothetical protein